MQFASISSRFMDFIPAWRHYVNEERDPLSISSTRLHTYISLPLPRNLTHMKGYRIRPSMANIFHSFIAFILGFFAILTLISSGPALLSHLPRAFDYPIWQLEITHPTITTPHTWIWIA